MEPEDIVEAGRLSEKQALEIKGLAADIPPVEVEEQEDGSIEPSADSSSVEVEEQEDGSIEPSADSSSEEVEPGADSMESAADVPPEDAGSEDAAADAEDGAEEA
jgi:hypothetical protein